MKKFIFSLFAISFFAFTSVNAIATTNVKQDDSKEKKVVQKNQEAKPNWVVLIHPDGSHEVLDDGNHSKVRVFYVK